MLTEEGAATGCRKVSRERVKEVRSRQGAGDGGDPQKRFLEEGRLMDVCGMPREELAISFSIWIMKDGALIWGRGVQVVALTVCVQMLTL